MTDRDPMVHQPPHYTAGRRFEPIDVLLDWFPHDPLLFNAAKYLSRAGRKGDAVQDLEKSLYFIRKAIEREEAKK